MKRIRTIALLLTIGLITTILISSCQTFNNQTEKTTDSLSIETTSVETTLPYTQITETTTCETTSALTTTVETSVLETSFEEPSYVEDMGKPSAFPLVCNRFCSAEEPNFTLPNGIFEDVTCGEMNEFNQYVFNNVDASMIQEYSEKLECEGFSAHRNKMLSGDGSQSWFFLKNDCFVSLRFKNADLYVSWYQKSQFAPDNAYSSSDIADLFYTYDSISPIELIPIDVTPEGFFERTGAQIFAIPLYRKDEYYNRYHKIDDYGDYYYIELYYVKNNEFYLSTYEEFAVYDVNHDGLEEICVITNGYTSGIYTFRVIVVSTRWICDTGFAPTKHLGASFEDPQGRLVVKNGESEEHGIEFFDVGIEVNGKSRSVFLENENGRLRTWGTRYDTDLSNIS